MPTASAFPNGNTEQGLKEIRTRLLDLTNRNKLLNFRFPTGSCLRFTRLGGPFEKPYPAVGRNG
jgi:hypothetical protein